MLLFRYTIRMELITPRLKIREFRADDLEALLEMDMTPLVQQYEPGELTEADIRYRLEGALEWAAENPRKIYKLVITVPPEDRLCGRLTLKFNPAGDDEWMIGWSLHPAHWGNGYATEGARAALRYAFRQLNAHRVTAYCHADNAASRRVMDRLGMQCEGRLRERILLHGRRYDELVYGILAGEFQAEQR